MKQVYFCIKLVITVAIIWLIYNRIDVKHFHFIQENLIFFAIIPVAWGLNLLFTTLRLYTLLRILGRSTRLRDVLNANMSSLFVGNVILGIGSDILKFFYFKKNDPAILKTHLALILGVDRILGLLAILVICSFFGSFIYFYDTALEPSLIYFLIMPILLFLSICIFLIGLHLCCNYISQFKLPPIFSNFLVIYNQLKEHNKPLIGLMMLYNILAVLLLLGGLVLVGGELQLQQAGQSMFLLQFFLIPLVLISAMIPLTPMGLGIAQVTMSTAYGLFGLEANVGLSISTLSQLGLLSLSILIGGPFFLFSKSKNLQFTTEQSA